MSSPGARTSKRLRTAVLSFGSRKPGPCRLLFIGVNWEEKGADTAVETLAELRARGVETELVICGCTPPKPISQDGLTIIPYLDKNDREQRNRLDQLYRDADLFLLPTRADCNPLCFAKRLPMACPALCEPPAGCPMPCVRARPDFGAAERDEDGLCDGHLRDICEPGTAGAPETIEP